MALTFAHYMVVIFTCVVQVAAGEHGAASQSGRAPVCSGWLSPACGRTRDLPEKCGTQQWRGPEAKRRAPEGRSAVPHGSFTSSHLNPWSCYGNDRPPADSWVVFSVLAVWSSINYWCQQNNRPTVELPSSLLMQDLLEKVSWKL